MLSIGDPAPRFVLPNQDDIPVSLENLLANGPLVLYFYPADFTPMCTKEACTIRDLHDELVEARLRIVGVSPQAPDMHRRFADKYKLPFTLLCDEDKSVITAFGVNGPLGFGVRRATFLIDQEGIIKDSVLADLRVGQHEVFVRRAITLQASND